MTDNRKKSCDSCGARLDAYGKGLHTSACPIAVRETQAPPSFLRRESDHPPVRCPMCGTTWPRGTNPRHMPSCQAADTQATPMPRVRCPHCRWTWDAFAEGERHAHDCPRGMAISAYWKAHTS